MTSIDFTTYLQISAKEIEKELIKFSKDWGKYVSQNVSDLQKLNTQFIDRLFGGKMLRGTLVRLGYELAGRKATIAIYKPAIAFEILHTSLLIHDDIIDQSPVRRGKPALHIAKDKHYGISQAICLGDLGISLSMRLISESDFPLVRKNKALSYFSHIISTTILGEMLDVQFSQGDNRTEEQILLMQRMKTARYTIVGPLTLGALLAGAPEKFLNTLKQFGDYLGIAFQIQDDLLGIFGDEKTIGKSTTSDIEENKSTLFITYSLKHGNKQQLETLKKYYGKKHISEKQQEAIKQIFIETGAVSYSQKKIKTLTDSAKALIPQITKNKEKQTLLYEFTDYLTGRNK